jgi:hypothetical protein
MPQLRCSGWSYSHYNQSLMHLATKITALCACVLPTNLPGLGQNKFSIYALFFQNYLLKDFLIKFQGRTFVLFIKYIF